MKKAHRFYFAAASKAKALEVVDAISEKFGVDKKYFNVFKTRYGDGSEYMVICSLHEEMVAFTAGQKGVW